MSVGAVHSVTPGLKNVNIFRCGTVLTRKVNQVLDVAVGTQRYGWNVTVSETLLNCAVGTTVTRQSGMRSGSYTRAWNKA